MVVSLITVISQRSVILGGKVIFQPHLGNFVRGILATIYVQLADGVTEEQVNAAYAQAYTDSPNCPLKQTMAVDPQCCWYAIL